MLFCFKTGIYIMIKFIKALAHAFSFKIQEKVIKTASGSSGLEHKRLGKLMVGLELDYFGLEHFQMTCPCSDSNHLGSKMIQIY
jgi:hypothetical protein